MTETLENLMQQIRGRFSGARQGRTEESSSKKKRTQNWFQKQFSGRMTSWNHDSDHITEQVVGVAAAAYVINSIAERSIRDQERTSAGLAPSLIRDKSRKEDTTRFSGESSTKGSEYAESKVPETDARDEKATRPAPSFRKSVSFGDHIGSTSQKPDMLSSQPESAAPIADLPPIKPERPALRPDLAARKPVSTAPKPDRSAIEPGTAATRPEPPPIPRPVTPGIDATRRCAARPGIEQTKADAWEKAEMAKIKEKYAKLNSTILAWEEKKKQKARNKLQKAENSGSEKKRTRALTKFRNEMDYIKEVADGARAQALSRQTNEELKAKEKANIIRTTGEVPKPCFCC